MVGTRPANRGIMTTNEPFEVDNETGIVTVCAWCWPGMTIAKHFPDLAKAELSHGICPAHMDDYFKKLDKTCPETEQS